MCNFFRVMYSIKSTPSPLWLIIDIAVPVSLLPQTYTYTHTVDQSFFSIDCPIFVNFKQAMAYTAVTCKTKNLSHP